MIPGQPFIQPSVHLIFCFFFSEQLCIFCFPHRSGIEISLSLVTAEPLKHYLLLFGLHTFRNDGKLHMISHSNDHVQDFFCSSIRICCTLETHIQFDFINRSFLQHIQGRISTSKIIHQNTESSLASVFCALQIRSTFPDFRSAS